MFEALAVALVIWVRSLAVGDFKQWILNPPVGTLAAKL